MTGLRSSLTALVLVGCLLIPLSATGFVLCLGADGHIALEPARNSRCANSMVPTASSWPQITSVPSQPDHCGPCLDVSLSASTSDDPQMFAAPSASPEFAAPVLALVAFVLPVPVALPQRPYVVLSSSCAHTLLALRTVILLL